MNNQNLESLRIKKVLFIVGSENYNFDVKPNITIKGLKKIICSAADLKKTGMKIFSKGEDFTDQNEKLLNEISPEDHIIEFKISIDEILIPKMQEESKLKYKIGQWCEEHSQKFTYFYCYNCSKSICLTCRDQSHKTHKMIEKYDYMQSSKYLVEIIFENIDLSPSVVDEKKKLAEGLKIKINEQFIPDIINLVKSVGEKQIDLIDRFINVVNDSVYNFKNNIELLKKECTEGLDIIKQDAHIENLMINEDVFLLIDRKYKEIEDERSRIISDQSKYNELNDRFNSIKLLIEDFYCINNDSITKFKSDSIYSHLK